MKYAWALALAGCVQVPEVPQGFVPVERGAYEWRAMSAQGVVLARQSRPRDPAGDAEFWLTVVRNEMERGGYALQSSEGPAMLFAAPGNAEQSYWVTLALSDKRITTLEAGGPKAEVEKELPRLKKIEFK